MGTKKRVKALYKKYKGAVRSGVNSAVRVLSAATVGTLGLGILGGVMVLGPVVHESYLINTLSPAVVKITHIANHNTGGTGFQIETRYGPKIITNAHVCLGVQDRGYVLVHTDRPKYIRKIEKVNPMVDLCMLDGDDELESLTLGSKPDTRDGVAILGHPLLDPQTFSRGKVVGDELAIVAIGFVNAEGECPRPGTFKDKFIGAFCLQYIMGTMTSAEIYPGNSGSPVVNFWGNVVGVIFAGNTMTNHGIFVPHSELKRFINNEY